MEFTAQQIAAFLRGTVEGDPEVKVSNFSKIEEGKPGTLTFLANPKYEHHIYHTEASIVLVNQDFTPTEPIHTTLIRVENAYTALAQLLNMVEQAKSKKSGVDSTAFIAPTASVGEDCYIGNMAYIGERVKLGNNCQVYPFAYIGDNVEIGDNTILYPHVTVYHDCRIGQHCILHAGSVIGADGFGFAPEGEQYKKIPQLGNVVIEDNVEIGANTTIDRAVMDSTIIRQGVKLDNLIQIAHNVEVGENTVMAAQVGIAGSVKVGLRHARPQVCQHYLLRNDDRHGRLYLQLYETGNFLHYLPTAHQEDRQRQDIPQRIQQLQLMGHQAKRLPHEPEAERL